MKNKSIQSIMLGLATISIILVSNGIVSYAQTNSSDITVGYNSSISNSSSTTVNNATSTSDNPVVQSIDAAIKAIKDGDKDSGKKSLLKAEEALEGKSDWQMLKNVSKLHSRHLKMVITTQQFHMPKKQRRVFPNYHFW